MEGGVGNESRFPAEVTVCVVVPFVDKGYRTKKYVVGKTGKNVRETSSLVYMSCV